MTETWREEILGMLNLEPNWDSYDGVAPSQLTVRQAIALVETVGIEPIWVSPEPHGGIALEFEGVHAIEVSVSPESVFEYVFVPDVTPEGIVPEWEEGEFYNVEELATFVKNRLNQKFEAFE